MPYSINSFPFKSLFSLAILSACFLGSVAEAVRIDHTLYLTIQHSDGVTMAIPPSITALEVTAPSQVSGPLYTGQTTEGTNALYTSGADPGSSGSVISVSFTLGETTSSTDAKGIVHRDIAARNFAVHTEEGTYEVAQGIEFLFTNDGPEDLRGVGPIRWMAPESLRTQTYTPNSTSDQTGYWELVGGAFFFEVAYPVPEPTSALLLTGTVFGTFGFGMLGGSRRSTKSHHGLRAA